MTRIEQDFQDEGERPGATRSTLRAIAVFEAVKGLAALAAIVGVLDLMHRDVHQIAFELIGRFGLDPDGRYPTILLHYADLLPGVNVSYLVVLAAAYILIRWLEALIGTILSSSP